MAPAESEATETLRWSNSNRDVKVNILSFVFFFFLRTSGSIRQSREAAGCDNRFGCNLELMNPGTILEHQRGGSRGKRGNRDVEAIK